MTCGFCSWSHNDYQPESVVGVRVLGGGRFRMRLCPACREFRSGRVDQHITQPRPADATSR